MTILAPRRLLVGGYTDQPSPELGPQGVVPIVHDLSHGLLSQDGPTLELASPSYLLQHPLQPVVYAVNETESGAVSAIGIDRPLRVRSTLAIPGELPCHLCLSPDLRHLLVANYGSGNVVAIRLDTDAVPDEITGVFGSYGTGPHPRQDGPHAHYVLPGPDGTIWVVDLGADVVRRLRIGRDGSLKEGEPVVALPPGTGPRQIKLHLGRKLAYVLGELSGELITVALEPGRSGTVVNRCPAWLTEPSDENLPAHLLVVGDRLYVSHRGLDRITVFNLKDGLPTPLVELETGAWPRHFALRGEWLYIAEQLDDQVTARTLTSSGDLFQPSRHTTIRRPSCLLLLD